MNRRTCEAAMAALLLAGAAAPAAAQRFPAIRPGQTVAGQLSGADPAFAQRGRFKVWRFDAAEGQRVIATLSSTDFDAYLTVARTVGGITETLKEDDDGGGETNSRLRFTVPAAGTYLLIAQSLAEDGLGGFSLGLQNAPAPVVTDPRPATLGEQIEGALEETDPVMEEDESFYDLYTIQGREGQRLVITMRSTAFDTYLGFGRMEGGELNATETDDDGAGEGTDSRLRVTIPADGEYVIRANSLGAGQTGGYTLLVEERTVNPNPAVPQPIGSGAEVSGTLDEGDAVLEDDSFYDYFIYQGHAGEQLTIEMMSDAFDTFLAIGRVLPGGEFEEVSSADDGGDGTNSRLEVTLPSDGQYVIRANSLMAGQTGEYSLRVATSRDR